MEGDGAGGVLPSIISNVDANIDERSSLVASLRAMLGAPGPEGMQVAADADADPLPDIAATDDPYALALDDDDDDDAEEESAHLQPVAEPEQEGAWSPVQEGAVAPGSGDSFTNALAQLDRGLDARQQMIMALKAQLFGGAAAGDTAAPTALAPSTLPAPVAQQVASPGPPAAPIPPLAPAADSEKWSPVTPQPLQAQRQQVTPQTAPPPQSWAPLTPMTPSTPMTPLTPLTPQQTPMTPGPAPPRQQPAAVPQAAPPPQQQLLQQPPPQQFQQQQQLGPPQQPQTQPRPQPPWARRPSIEDSELAQGAKRLRATAPDPMLMGSGISPFSKDAADAQLLAARKAEMLRGLSAAESAMAASTAPGALVKAAGAGPAQGPASLPAAVLTPTVPHTGFPSAPALGSDASPSAATCPPGTSPEQFEVYRQKCWKEYFEWCSVWQKYHDREKQESNGKGKGVAPRSLSKGCGKAAVGVDAMAAGGAVVRPEDIHSKLLG